MNKVQELIMGRVESDNQVIVRFPAIRSTGLLNLDYLQEEMLLAFEHRAYFAAITAASTLVEMALRYYLVLFDAIDSGTHPAELLIKWKKRTLNRLIDDAASRGVDPETIHDLHEFRAKVRNHFVHGGLSPYDHVYDSEAECESQGAAEDGEAFNRLLAFAFLGPLELIMRSESTALFAVTLALKLTSTNIPWEGLLAPIGMPELKAGNVVFYTPKSGGAEIGCERSIRVSKGSFEAFDARWRNDSKGE